MLLYRHNDAKRTPIACNGKSMVVGGSCKTLTLIWSNRLDTHTLLSTGSSAWTPLPKLVQLTSLGAYDGERVPHRGVEVKLPRVTFL